MLFRLANLSWLQYLISESMAIFTKFLFLQIEFLKLQRSQCYSNPISASLISFMSLAQITGTYPKSRGQGYNKSDELSPYILKLESSIYLCWPKLYLLVHIMNSPASITFKQPGAMANSNCKSRGNLLIIHFKDLKKSSRGSSNIFFIYDHLIYVESSVAYVFQLAYPRSKR